MRYREVFDELKRTSGLAAATNSDIAKVLGFTPSRISQLYKSRKQLTALKVARLVKRSVARQRKDALRESIRPVVELYPITRVGSKQDAKWELLACDKSHHARNYHIRAYLDKARGIYFFYNSQGEILYAGKTEKQSLWKEMTLTFNRERASHKAFMVKHPTTGKTFHPAWKKLRQPIKTVVYLHDVARFFSAYEVSADLIAQLEALMVRSICNDVSNVRMERFKSSP